jgi:hypothetical protein
MERREAQAMHGDCAGLEYYNKVCDEVVAAASEWNHWVSEWQTQSGCFKLTPVGPAGQFIHSHKASFTEFHDICFAVLRMRSLITLCSVFHFLIVYQLQSHAQPTPSVVGSVRRPLVDHFVPQITRTTRLNRCEVLQPQQQQQANEKKERKLFVTIITCRIFKLSLLPCSITQIKIQIITEWPNNAFGSE